MMTSKSNIKMFNNDYDDDDDDDDVDSIIESVDHDEINDAEEMVSQSPAVKKVASVMNKLLSSKEEGVPAILSKAKFNREDSSNEDEAELDERVLKRRKLEKRKKKKELLEMSRIDPRLNTNREKERTLRIIATQGVVQLFSAINKHKVELKRELRTVKSAHQRDKVYASKGEDNFMNLLNNGATHQPPNLMCLKKEKKEVKLETEAPMMKPRWNALAQDFYKESTLNDWDKYDSDHHT